MQIHQELYRQYVYETGVEEEKDVIVIVHDQLNYTKQCIDSLFANTKGFTLYLWDNNSLPPTREYLEKVARENDNVVLKRHPENLGFIRPNNEMVAMSKSPYKILLNSDTKVERGWDSAMVGWLKGDENCGVVGYQGGILQADGIGSAVEIGLGEEIDYVCGWCMCFSSRTYEEFGLFDEKNLEFAYGEDSDFSMRLKEAGKGTYALSLKLVKHYGNKTSMEVQKEKDTSGSFESNHAHIRRRWGNYLKRRRIKEPGLV